VPFALELKKRVPDFSFVIVGGGKNIPALREEIQKAGLQDCVTVHGFVESMQDVLALLAKAGVAIAPYFPFDKNSFTFYSDPGKIKTYLGCGLPIVLTDVPPIAKTLANEQVGKIASYDAADFAEKVAEIINTPDYNRLRTHVQDFGRRFDWNIVFETAFANGGLC
jgi:glycosyltransferase involved in cell wall biosynthesis